MIKVVIRTDASKAIGSGHVMRCLTLAEELRQRKVDVRFVCRKLPGHLIDNIRKKGFKVHALPCTAVDDIGRLQEDDAAETAEILKKTESDYVIVDHYSLDKTWQCSIRPFTQWIVVIDDLANREHDCDVLLDQTYGTTKERYKNLVPDTCQTMIGSDYILLREEFRTKREKAIENRFARDNIRTILISFGGVDHENTSLLALQACENFYPKLRLKIHLVIGAANSNRTELEKFINTSRQDITLHIDTERMADLMVEADLAIGAGGTTSWERCALGLPTLAVCVADNQRKVIENLSKNKALINLGDVKELTCDKVKLAIGQLIEDNDTFRAIQNNALSICNGNGTERFVSHLLGAKGRVMDRQMTIRPAITEDAEDIYNWRQDPHTRKMSFDDREINFHDHLAWYSKKLKDENAAFYIAHSGSIKIGVVRFDKSDLSVTVSINLNPEARGKGQATELLSQSINKLKNQWTFEEIIAQIKPENKKSIKLFEKVGFAKKSRRSDILEYVKYENEK